MTPASRAARFTPKFKLTLPPRELAPLVVVTAAACSLEPSPAAAAAAAVAPAEGDVADAGRATEPPSRRRGSGPVFEASEVIPGLYLGSWQDAEDAEQLLRHGIRRVVNIASECPISASCLARQDAISVLKLDVIDHSDVDISAHFQTAFAFIRGALENRQGVLVHCRHGVSRSATIVLAYIMTHGAAGSPMASPTTASAAVVAASSHHADPAAFATVLFPHVASAASDSSDRSDGGASLDSCDSDLAQPMSYARAFDIVKAKRPKISPNLGFVLALHDLEARRGAGTEVPCCA